MLSNKELRLILKGALDRLQVVATTGQLDVEETSNYVEGVQAILDANEDADESSTKNPLDPANAPD